MSDLIRFLITNAKMDAVFGQVAARSEHDALLAIMDKPERYLVGDLFRQIAIGPQSGGVQLWPFEELIAGGAWREVAPVGAQPHGDCGGDIQTSDSFGRRFVKVRPDGTLAVVTYIWYAVNTDVDFVQQDTPGTSMQLQIEYIICDDLRDLDYVVWTDYRYRETRPSWFHGGYDDAGARELAERFNHTDIDWDGEEFR